MASLTVTATQGGSTGPGMALRVYALTSVSGGIGPNIGVQSATGAAAKQVSITTTVTGSMVYGAIAGSPNTAFTANANTTLIDNIADGTNGMQYGTCRSTSATGTPGAITIGATTSVSGGIAVIEVLPNGTVTVDGSSPAVVSSLSATTLTTASFTPPGGSLLVAMVSTDGGAAQTTATVSGGGLVWSARAQANVSAADYAGVWTALVPIQVSRVSVQQAVKRASLW